MFLHGEVRSATLRQATRIKAADNVGLAATGISAFISPNGVLCYNRCLTAAMRRTIGLT